MKEASGELNMTVVTIIAITAVGALFYFVVWPIIQRSIVSQTCKTYGTDWHAVKGAEIDEGTSAETYTWICCPAGVNSGKECVGVD